MRLDCRSAEKIPFYFFAVWGISGLGPVGGASDQVTENVSVLNELFKDMAALVGEQQASLARGWNGSEMPWLVGCLNDYLGG